MCQRLRQAPAIAALIEPLRTIRDVRLSARRYRQDGDAVAIRLRCIECREESQLKGRCEHDGHDYKPDPENAPSLGTMA